MAIDLGTKYQISQAVKGNFNSAESLTVTSNDGSIVQFTLGEGKGRGAMPLQHLDYLLKRSNLTILPNKRSLITPDHNEEQIG